MMRIDTTATLIARHATTMPWAVAVVEATQRRTWQDLAAHLAGAVAILEAGGIRRGMLVGVEMGRLRYASLLLLLACEVIGAPATAFARPDLARDDPVLPDCERLILIGTALEPGASLAHGVMEAVVIPRSFPDAPIVQVPLHPLSTLPDQDRIVRISRTSGSTGRPKAVPITYAVQQRIIAQRIASLPAQVAGSARFLCLYSLSVRGVYTRVYAALQAGGTVFFGFAEEVPALLRTGAANWILAIVGEAEQIARATGQRAAQCLLFEMIGARVPRGLRDLLRKTLGATVQVTYSSNETNTVSFVDDRDIGTLVDGAEVRIVDAGGHDVPLGETGLVRVRTATMARFYWNDPVQSATAFVDGWYQTQDLGFMPEPGRLVIVGRADDMLNVGGVKLPPGPVEDEMRTLPGVRDVALVALAGPAGSDTLIVAVEVTPDAAVDDLYAAARPILRRYVASFTFLPLPSFPRTETGKIRRKEIEATVRRRGP